VNDDLQFHVRSPGYCLPETIPRNPMRLDLLQKPARMLQRGALRSSNRYVFFL
jgi:hypothetical protein